MSNLSYRRGDIIFSEDAFSTTMYEVLAGSVGIYKSYGTNNERQLASLKAHETFGEMGLAECYPRSATAVALEDGTVVYEIASAEFASYFEDNPDKVLSIMRQLSERIRDTNAKYLEACQTVYDAIEEERAGRKRSRIISKKIGELVQSLRLFGKSRA
ncbi:MAG: cyclic nucleotide-binding domain-containing protein [Coriobacteriales bacterium]|nr:cyclic nucleotide-binding domain-containing protein [Coriobacteriales bacterium]